MKANSDQVHLILLLLCLINLSLLQLANGQLEAVGAVLSVVPVTSILATAGLVGVKLAALSRLLQVLGYNQAYLTSGGSGTAAHPIGLQANYAYMFPYVPGLNVSIRGEHGSPYRNTASQQLEGVQPANRKTYPAMSLPGDYENQEKFFRGSDSLSEIFRDVGLKINLPPRVQQQQQQQQQQYPQKTIVGVEKQQAPEKGNELRYQNQAEQKYSIPQQQQQQQQAYFWGNQKQVHMPHPHLNRFHNSETHPSGSGLTAEPVIHTQPAFQNLPNPPAEHMVDPSEVRPSSFHPVPQHNSFSHQQSHHPDERPAESPNANREPMSPDYNRLPHHHPPAIPSNLQPQNVRPPAPEQPVTPYIVNSLSAPGAQGLTPSDLMREVMPPAPPSGNSNGPIVGELVTNMNPSSLSDFPPPYSDETVHNEIARSLTIPMNRRRRKRNAIQQTTTQTVGQVPQAPNLANMIATNQGRQSSALNDDASHNPNFGMPAMNIHPLRRRRRSLGDAILIAARFNQ